MPVQGARLRQVANTFCPARSAWRTHQGAGYLCPQGSPYLLGHQWVCLAHWTEAIGRTVVFVVGPGGRRYYFAHLERYATGLMEGQKVTTRTLLGYMGNSVNARTTPPHLHFGVYSGSGRTCDYRVNDPLPLLADRY